MDQTELPPPHLSSLFGFPLLAARYLNMLHLWDWTAKQYKIIAPLSGEERQLAIESIDARLRNCYLLPCIFK